MAIDDLLDEHDRAKKDELTGGKGAGLIGGVILGLALIGGWQWWQNQRQAAQVADG